MVVGFAAGYLFTGVWCYTTRKIGHWAHWRGLHFHDSLFGLLAFALIPFFGGRLATVLFLAGLGSGAIVEHTVRDGFRFVTRD